MTELGIADVLALIGVGKATVYRWMSRHPTLTVKDPDSAKGRPFPKPVRKQGREVLWSKDEVNDWWSANVETVGRHPEEGAITTLPWAALRRAMSTPPRRVVADDGSEHEVDDMALVQEFVREGDSARVRFRSADDAVFFKLKY